MMTQDKPEIKVNKLFILNEKSVGMMNEGDSISFIPLSPSEVVHRKLNGEYEEGYDIACENFIAFNALVHNRSTGLLYSGSYGGDGITPDQYYAHRVTAVLIPHNIYFSLAQKIPLTVINPEQGSQVAIADEMTRSYPIVLEVEKSMAGDLGLGTDTMRMPLRFRWTVDYFMKHGVWLQYKKTPYHFWKRQLGI
ncbi:hypothetical protein GR7B_00044 [Vibrio phage vB_VcorM_GR7B]|nr:hypothetical protein GR7B_00044 [Vibrio phage vB_VcorM_GR7B]